jgi:hypothetical protein
MDISAQEIRKYLGQLKSIKWLGLAAHLQRSALADRRSAIETKVQLIRISILVDGDGTPLFWSEPECTPIAPAKNAMNWLNQL